MEGGGAAAAGSRSGRDSKTIINLLIDPTGSGYSGMLDECINSDNFYAMRTALKDPNAYKKTEKNDKIVIDAIYAQTELTAPMKLSLAVAALTRDKKKEKKRQLDAWDELKSAAQTVSLPEDILELSEESEEEVINVEEKIAAREKQLAADAALLEKLTRFVAVKTKTFYRKEKKTNRGKMLEQGIPLLKVMSDILMSEIYHLKVFKMEQNVGEIDSLINQCEALLQGIKAMNPGFNILDLQEEQELELLRHRLADIGTECRSVVQSGHAFMLKGNLERENYDQLIQSFAPIMAKIELLFPEIRALVDKVGTLSSSIDSHQMEVFLEQTIQNKIEEKIQMMNSKLIPTDVPRAKIWFFNELLDLLPPEEAQKAGLEKLFDLPAPDGTEGLIEDSLKRKIHLCAELLMEDAVQEAITAESGNAQRALVVVSHQVDGVLEKLASYVVVAKDGEKLKLNDSFPQSEMEGLSTSPSTSASTDDDELKDDQETAFFGGGGFEGHNDSHSPPKKTL
jgi:hypothetical protein